MSCLKQNNAKIYIKINIETAPDMFRCYSYTIIRKRINLCLLKLQLLKYSVKIDGCVVNTLVVCLHILGPYWCLCVALPAVQHTDVF